jgi:hypothetical protein
VQFIFRFAGVAASIVLIALGAGAIVVGLNGRSDVGDNLRQEAIVGTPDMTPAAIAREAKAAGLTNVSLPSCSVAGERVDTGSEARCFAEYMRVHALEATGGKTYAQMPRYDRRWHGYERRGERAHERRPAGRQPGPQRVGHRDSAEHGPQHVVLRSVDGAVRDRDGRRAAADRDRLPAADDRSPGRHRRGAPRPSQRFQPHAGSPCRRLRPREREDEALRHDAGALRPRLSPGSARRR